MLPLYPAQSVSQGTPQALLTDLPQVIGSDGAKRYPTKPNARDAVWDKDENYIYVRQTDITGNITSITRLSYQEAPEPRMEDIFVTKEAFESLRSEMNGGLSDVKEYISNLAATIAANKPERESLPNPEPREFNQTKGNGKGNGERK